MVLKLDYFANTAFTIFVYKSTQMKNAEKEIKIKICGRWILLMF